MYSQENGNAVRDRNQHITFAAAKVQKKLVIKKRFFEK